MTKNATTVDYDKVYEDWDNLEQCRVHIAYERAGERHGERTWGRVLPDGTFGIDNHPLCPDYRWQDVVRDTEVTSEKFLVHRRWNTLIWCTYTPASSDDGTGDVRQRRAMVAACPNDVHVGWWSEGVFFVHFIEKMSDEDAFERVLGLFGELADNVTLAK